MLFLKAAHLIWKTLLNPFIILVQTGGCGGLQIDLPKSFINVAKMKGFEAPGRPHIVQMPTQNPL